MSLENIDFTQAPRNPPSCVECEKKTRLAVSGLDHYPETELHGLPIWECECGAFGRCKPGTIIPCARPGSAETRAARGAAYAAMRAYSEGRARVKVRGKWRSGDHQARFLLSRHLKKPMFSLQFGWMTKEEALSSTSFFDGLSESE